MSFVVGFVTGVTAGEAVERNKERGHFFQYMQRQGYTIIDRIGRQVPLEKIMKEALKSDKKSWRRFLVIGVGLMAVAAVTGGSAWVFLSAV